MTKIILLLITFVALHCAEDDASVGEVWDAVVVKLNNNAWRDTMIKFELEKEFADRGGKIKVWENRFGMMVWFTLLPKNNVLIIDSVEIRSESENWKAVKIKTLLLK